MRTHETAGQAPFVTGSRMATHSTWCVIGSMSAWTQGEKQQVRAAFGFRMRASGRRERQMSVTAQRWFGPGNLALDGSPKSAVTPPARSLMPAEPRRCALCVGESRGKRRGRVIAASFSRSSVAFSGRHRPRVRRSHTSERSPPPPGSPTVLVAQLVWSRPGEQAEGTTQGQSEHGEISRCLRVRGYELVTRSC